MSLSLIAGAKVALIATVGIVTLVASLAPFYIARALSSRRALDVISCASAASAGIVVGAFLCHMLPEASRSFEDYLSSVYPDNDQLVQYPFSGLLCASVLSFLISIDALIVRRGMGDDEGASHAHGGGGAQHNHVSDGLQKFITAASKAHESPRASPPPTLSAVLTPPPPPGSAASPSLGYGATMRVSGKPRQGAEVVVSRGSGGDASPSFTRPSLDTTSAGSSSDSTSLLHPDVVSEEEVAHAAAGGTPHNAALLRAYVFFAALSLHGIFDGLSVGSENDPQGFTSTTVAVVSHKLFDGLALGCALFPANLPHLHRYVLLVSSAMTTPLGIGIGMGAAEAVGAGSVRLVNGIVLSMAAGSFAFISLCELLPSSLADGRWIVPKLLSFVAGIAGMCTLAAFV